MNIPFNKPFSIDKELDYIKEAVDNNKLSGDGIFNKKCSLFLHDYFGENNSGGVYITPSCTAASEMASLIIDIKDGDEVIMPSFTFTSTANSVVVYGAVPVFVDSRKDTLNIDESLIENAITKKTKAIVPVHYAGVGCDMETIISIAKKYNLYVIEDNAQGLFSYYKGRPLGSFGDLSAVSFHETKNIICGEGGALAVNSENIRERAEIIREKGTDRSKFFRGEVDKYSWIEKGSSYLLSELGAAYLYAQLEKGKEITQNRLDSWNYYYDNLKELEDWGGAVKLPIIPKECQHNAHIFYIILESLDIREKLRTYLKDNGILAVSHYVPLHSSKAGKLYGRVGSNMSVTDSYSERILRLPMYYGLTNEEKDYIIEKIYKFFKV